MNYKRAHFRFGESLKVLHYDTPHAGGRRYDRARARLLLIRWTLGNYTRLHFISMMSNDHR